MSNFAVEVVTWKTFYSLCDQLAEVISASGFEPDCVVAIGRGGWVPGRVMADMLDWFDLATIKVEHYQQTQHEQEARVSYPLTASVEGKKILILDDLCDSGDTFDVAVEHVRSLGSPRDIKTACLLYKQVSSFEPDYYVQKLTEWRWITFPWAVVEDVTGMLARCDEKPASRQAMEDVLRREFEVALESEAAQAVWHALQRSRQRG